MGNFSHIKCNEGNFFYDNVGIQYGLKSWKITRYVCTAYSMWGDFCFYGDSLLLSVVERMVA